MREKLGNAHALHSLVAAMIGYLGGPAYAQSTEQTLPTVTVEEVRSVSEQNQLPATTESVMATQAAEKINAMNVEDTLKYLPSVLVRKRYIGDTSAPMATRTTGINASARSLIYADGILLSTLINNNNQNGSPQWFMVTPEEAERIDVMYGPFSAMYPGNSFGAVTEITTRMPEQFEANARLSTALQDFSQYGTSDHIPATQASVNFGNRAGRLAWWVSASHLNSFSQPVTYLTVRQSTLSGSGNPVIHGAFAERDRAGNPIQVVGAGNLTHTVQDTVRAKLAYDITPAVTAAYSLGYWQNSAHAKSQSYLADAAGTPYFGGAGNVNIGGNAYNGATIGNLFSSNTVEQEHWMQSLSLKTKNLGEWNWEAIVTDFNYGKDITRTSTGPYPAAQSSGPGRIADAGDTGWNTVDLKGTWRQPGKASRHTVRFGAHYDLYKLESPTFSTSNWVSGRAEGLLSDSRGKTRTEAVWAQDAWRIAPSVIATIGGRYERWRAYDGILSPTAKDPVSQTDLPPDQPEVRHSGFSPKLSLVWQATDQWSLTGSFGKALRFPTVGELYQNVQSGTSIYRPNPFLKPERVLAGELAAERNADNSRLRVSIFEEHVSDALISQTSTIAGVAQALTFVQNVDKTRQHGIELVAQQTDALIKGLELSGSITYVSARILANRGYVPTIAGASSVGKRTPYVPEWRATIVATYRPDEKWAYTLAGRYSSRLFATVDNTDVNPSTYQGFEGYFVADARVQYKFDKHWSAAAGVDNINNRKYFLFHPFPQRTVLAELKYSY